jgi:hypothetical protein
MTNNHNHDLEISINQNKENIQQVISDIASDAGASLSKRASAECKWTAGQASTNFEITLGIDAPS